ncbi:DUF1643 domain-containing protein [Pseudomonas frederiksbergensis]
MTTMQLFPATTTLPFPSASGALLSECRTYRYALWRSWETGSGYVCFIGLNPSTADETIDDRTIRRCMAFAKAWGYSGMVMLNLFAFRATDPADMLAAVDPVGPDSDRHFLEFTRSAGVVVAAWGNDGAHLGRHRAVAQIVPHLHCLKVTKAGYPGHPLYLKGDLIPIPFEVLA